MMRPKIRQVKLRILENQVNDSPITKPEKVSPIEPIATTDSCETPTYLDGPNDQVGAISKDTQNSKETQENQIPKTFLNSYKLDGTNHLIAEYMNLEQNLFTKTITLRRMMSINESWNDFEETLTKLNMEYASFDKF